MTKLKIYAQSLKFKNQNEWFKHTKSKNFPKDIPESPNQGLIKKSWKSWGDFLGTGILHIPH